MCGEQQCNVCAIGNNAWSMPSTSLSDIAPKTTWKDCSG
jgi:hypothetical protein